MSEVLVGKRVVLGVTGGIAAYKTATLCSRLVQAGAQVEVVMTGAAQKFVTPLTFQALTHRSVHTDMFHIPGGENIPHIILADGADLLVIAPATANTLAKIANGLANDLLSTIALASPAPILLAPAMESDMWQHPATQANVARLQSWGVTMVDPAEGRLASGAVGQGRLAEPEVIIEMARVVLARQGDLAGRHIVVTAGGTREAIDPVRFISNHSSGKMGYAIALAARDRGAHVTLITSATLPAPIGVEVVPVDSAREMLAAVLDSSQQANALIMSAAVADFRPVSVAEQKIKKKGDSEGMVLDLTRNPDILAEVALRKAETGFPQVTVGFAAETQDVLANAQAKLVRKRLDFIVANDITVADAGFAVETNRVTILGVDGSKTALPLLTKREVAEEILDRVAHLLPVDQ